MTHLFESFFSITWPPWNSMIILTVSQLDEVELCCTRIREGLDNIIINIENASVSFISFHSPTILNHHSLSFLGWFISCCYLCNETRINQEPFNRFLFLFFHLFDFHFLSSLITFSLWNNWWRDKRNFKFSFPRWNRSWGVGFEFERRKNMSFQHQTGFNKFGDEGCVHLAEGLKKNKSLKKLTLTRNMSNHS